MEISFYGLLEYGKEALKASGVAEYETDAWLLFSFVTGMDRTRYLCSKRESALPEHVHRYQELIRQRAKRIPLQYLAGEQTFMGLSFEVNRHVLIPRQDTEVLVREAGRLIESKDSVKVLDMCTGSGCIIVSLAYQYGVQGNRKIAEAAGADISKEALLLAGRNAKRYGTEVSFIESNLFSKISGCYDIIVSNPPYIRTDEIAELEPEVRDYEPLLALDGREDGLFFYRAITERAGDYLSAEGFLAFEIGCDQAEEVCSILRLNGFQDIRVTKDLAGLDRVCTGRKRENKNV